MRRNRIECLILVGASLVWFMPAGASALITFSTVYRPVENRDWPTGTERVANLISRVVSVSGPGMGESCFGYWCSDTAEFNAALKKFGAIRAPRPTRRSLTAAGSADIVDGKPFLLVVHDYQEDLGERVGWKFLTDRIDWIFTVWAAEYFHDNFNRPQSRFSGHPYYRQPVAAPRIDVFAGGDSPIIWDQVNVPSNVRVIDKRAGAAPVDVEDGGVIRGRLFDMATHQVIAGADVVLMKRMKPRRLEEAARTKSDETGAFDVRGIGEGYYDIRVEAEGYAGRDVGGYDNRGGHSFHDFDALLARTCSLCGKVVDTDGNPVPGVIVYARETWGIDSLEYNCSREPTATTDKEGRFELRSLPRGYTTVRCREPSLHQKSINSDPLAVGRKPLYKPEEATIVVEGTGTVRGRVFGDDGNPPRRTFMVEIEPGDGAAPGTWGGVMRCKEDGAFEFKGVPPGEYVVIARPNPMRDGEASEPKLVTVTAGGAVSLEIANAHAHSER